MMYGSSAGGSSSSSGVFDAPFTRQQQHQQQVDDDEDAVASTRMPLRRRENDSFASPMNHRHGVNISSTDYQQQNQQHQYYYNGATAPSIPNFKRRKHHRRNHDATIVRNAVKAVAVSPVVVLVIWFVASVGIHHRQNTYNATPKTALSNAKHHQQKQHHGNNNNVLQNWNHHGGNSNTNVNNERWFRHPFHHFRQRNAQQQQLGMSEEYDDDDQQQQQQRYLDEGNAQPVMMMMMQLPNGEYVPAPPAMQQQIPYTMTQQQQAPPVQQSPLVVQPNQFYGNGQQQQQQQPRGMPMPVVDPNNNAVVSNPSVTNDIQQAASLPSPPLQPMVAAANGFTSTGNQTLMNNNPTLQQELPVQQQQQPVQYYYYDPSITKTDKNGNVVLPDVVYDTSGQSVKLQSLGSQQPPIIVQEQQQLQQQQIPMSSLSQTGNAIPLPPQQGIKIPKVIRNGAAQAVNTVSSSNLTGSTVILTTVAVMALLVGAFSARRLRNRPYLGLCIENEVLDEASAYDTAYTIPVTQQYDGTYSTFGTSVISGNTTNHWNGDLEKFDV